MNYEDMPCQTCGRATELPNSPQCNLCWEVESRLSDYLWSERGRSFAIAHLEDALCGDIRVETR